MGRFTFALLFTGLLVGLGACEKTTVGAKGKKLTLTKPADQTIRRGETNDIKISIDREDFRDAVTVHFEGLPQGVRVQDETRQIMAEDSSGTFTLRADPDAMVVKDQEVRVVVSAPGGGPTATQQFKLTVKDKS